MDCNSSDDTRKINKLLTFLDKLNHAQKIVNEFGQAIVKGTEINKEILVNSENKSSYQIQQSIKNKDSYHYALQNKFDIHLLPYDKKAIKESIELLIEYETDVEKKNDLFLGLIYLDDFIEHGGT